MGQMLLSVVAYPQVKWWVLCFRGLDAFRNTSANVALVEVDPDPSSEVECDTLEQKTVAYELGKKQPLSQAFPVSTNVPRCLTTSVNEKSRRVTTSREKCKVS